MKLSILLALAIRNLRRAPTRSALTALGIVVGVAAIVTTSSIGRGAELRIQEALEKPGTRLVQLIAMLPAANGRPAIVRLPPSERVRLSDYYAIRDGVATAAISTIWVTVPSVHVRARGRAEDVTLYGLDVEGFEVYSRRLMDGVLFRPFDIERAAAVCVIGSSLARFLYSTHSPVGETLLLNGSAFTIVGVVDDPAATASEYSATQSFYVYMPFTSLLRRLDSGVQLGITVQARDVVNIGAVQANISDTMEQRRRGRKTRFLTMNSIDAIKSYADGSLTVARLLAAMGAVSLIVGGIGIMNIMLVSVSERTREIGVRIAIGTRPRHLLMQFLIESSVLSVLGGGLGVVAGWIVSEFVTRINNWPTVMTLSSIMSALACSWAMGLFFGYHPARRAAEVEPMHALRTE